MTIAAMKKVADALNKANIGYDQANRWSFYKAGRIVAGAEGDCSTICGVIAKLGGYEVDLSGTFYTGNFADKLRRAGFAVLPFRSLDDVRDGDFLLTPGHHVEFCWPSSGKMFSAIYDERGKASGGKAGNQSGKETGWRKLAVRPGGWTYIVRPPAEDAGPVKFRMGSYNAQLKSAGGGWYSKDGTFIKKVLKVSVLATQETNEQARDAIRKKTGHKVWENNSLGVYWDPNKYDHGGKIEDVDLGTAHHGLVATLLNSRANGESFVLASAHVRPNAAFPTAWSDERKLEGKLADVRAILEVLKKYPRVVVGGDWNTKHARDVIESYGYTLATPWKPTNDAGQYLDGIYVRGLDVRGGSLHTTPASDHHGLVANLTLAPISTL